MEGQELLCLQASVGGAKNKRLGLGYESSFLTEKQTLPSVLTYLSNLSINGVLMITSKRTYEEIYQNLGSADIACKHPESL